MAVKLFVGNCDYTLMDRDLEAFITEQGMEVASVQIIIDRQTGRSKGFGFVELENIDIEEAIEKLNGQELKGRNLTVNEARERQPRFDNSGGFGGGGPRGGGGGGRGGRGGKGGNRGGGKGGRW